MERPIAKFLMTVLGYVSGIASIWMFISAYRYAQRLDLLEHRRKQKFAVGLLVVFGIFLLMLGIWLTGAFKFEEVEPYFNQ
jgi:accessory gene regulator protein AgrB